MKGSGCTIFLNTTLKGITANGNKVSRISLMDTATHSTRWLDVDSLIVAIPPERVTRLVNDELYMISPRLGNFHHLETNPIASLNVYFRRRIPDIPAEVVSLLDSHYGLTFIDISQLWDQPERTSINVVASRFRPLASVTAKLAQKEILADLKRFIPFDDADIDSVNYQPHLDQPLFSCMVGSWKHRPGPSSGLQGLYFCGDYCRSHVDVVCLESAVTTGLNAASDVIDDHRVTNRVVVRKPFVYARWKLLLSKYLLFPVALACYGWAIVSARWSRPAP